jgi:hypothetical protein
MSGAMKVVLPLFMLVVAANAEKATPVQKVVELLNGMLEKGKKRET